MAGKQLTNLVKRIRHLADSAGSSPASDSQLLRLYAESGDGSAFATLVQRHGPLVFGVCNRVLGNSHDAEDAFQAVFVVLARKAGAGSWDQSVGPWLHEVAHRIALKARARGFRREQHERRAANMRPTRTTAEPTWREVRGVLDDELGRLPAKYKAPLLLCYLEGKSNEEAAGQLGWPAGTVKSRLSRGRDLLRSRLTRRGLTLSAELLVLLLAQNASAAVPEPLIDGIVKAALQIAAGQAYDGLTGLAAALVQGEIRVMWLAKLRTIAVVASLVLVAGSASWLGLRTWAADPAGPVVKADETKLTIVLPSDPQAVVLSMQVKGGRILNKTPDPYLLVRADGRVVVTNRATGAKKESKLTSEQLLDLLRFVVRDNDFFTLDQKTIAASVQAAEAGQPLRAQVSDAASTTISVRLSGKEHDAGYSAAHTYSTMIPKAKALGQYAAIERRLLEFALAVEKGK